MDTSFRNLLFWPLLYCWVIQVHMWSCSSVSLLWDSMVGMYHTIYPTRLLIWGLPRIFFPFLPVTNAAIMTILYPSPGTCVRVSQRYVPKNELWHTQLWQTISVVVVPKCSYIYWQLIYLGWLRLRNTSSIKLSKCIFKTEN